MGTVESVCYINFSQNKGWNHLEGDQGGDSCLCHLSGPPVWTTWLSRGALPLPQPPSLGSARRLLEGRVPYLPRGGAVNRIGHRSKKAGRVLSVNAIHSRHFSDFTGFATRT